MLTAAEKYTVFFRCALVAGVFSCLLGTLLLVDYSARVAEDPLNAPEYVALKAQLKANPQDAAVKDQLRQLDLRLRHEYFQRRRFSAWGTWLLLASVVITLACAKQAAVLHRRLPQPQPRDVPDDPEERLRRFSRWSVAAFGGAIILGVVGLWAGVRSVVDAPTIQFAAAPGDAEPEQPAAPRTEPQVAPPQAEPPPSPPPETPPPAVEKSTKPPLVPPVAASAPAEKPPTMEPAPVKEPAEKPPAEKLPAQPASVPAEPASVPAQPASVPAEPPKPEAKPPKTEAEPAKPATAALAGAPTPEHWRRNWPRFRGPDGTGVSASADIPTKWNGATGEGILWKTALALPGNNSPIVWDKHVFVTGADETQRVVYCCDADTGKLLWQTEVPGTPESTATPPKIMEATGYAAPTPATDGQRVYAMFANGDLAAVDFAGQVTWSRSLGLPKNTYGHAASLALYGDLLLVQFDQGTKQEKLSQLMALKAPTGETAWEVSREVPNSWPTPTVIEHQGQPQIITAADPWVIAYAPSDGREIWRAKCLQADVGPSPTFADGLVFVANEFPGMAAIRADGAGDVTGSHVLWEADVGSPDCCSPLATDKFLMVLASFGTLTCYNAKEGGEPLWEEDFDDANFSSSPALAGKHVYLFSEQGKVFLIEPTDEKCVRVAENELGEECVTSPAFQPGRIYIRGKEHLICIGAKPP
ncbi:MAG: PQQ-binding-like beta-propeller repeat protein [Candidatus Anammoximicrobium sp.]|nr:PQQ-binding-like beta-propeller repeat protein [Candidatus Anammoximicrobium sp.]